MNDTELAELLAKASPRPWRYDGRDVFSAELVNESGIVLPIPEPWHPSQRVNEADIRLLVEAVNRLEPAESIRSTPDETPANQGVEAPSGFEPLFQSAELKADT